MYSIVYISLYFHMVWCLHFFSYRSPPAVSSLGSSLRPCEFLHSLSCNLTVTACHVTVTACHVPVTVSFPMSVLFNLFLHAFLFIVIGWSLFVILSCHSVSFISHYVHNLNMSCLLQFLSWLFSCFLCFLQLCG